MLYQLGFLGVKQEKSTLSNTKGIYATTGGNSQNQKEGCKSRLRTGRNCEVWAEAEEVF